MSGEISLYRVAKGVVYVQDGGISINKPYRHEIHKKIVSGKMEL